MMSGSREKLEELKKKVKELEEQLEREQKQADSSVPKIGQRYWYLAAQGSILCSVWQNTHADNLLLTFGNVYLTEAEAIKAQQQRFTEVRVITRLRELEGGFVADWGSENQQKCFVHFNHAQKGFFIDVCQVCQSCPPHWLSTRKAWNQVIKEMESDVKLMMGVEV